MKKDEFGKYIEQITRNNKKIKLLNYTVPENFTKYIAASDCIVIPSKCDDAFALVSLEAMAMKKCIISSNSGGLIEPLNNDCAIIINKDNLEPELYNAMKKAYLDKENSKRLALNAFNRVYDIEQFNKDNYLNFLEEAFKLNKEEK